MKFKDLKGCALVTSLIRRSPDEVIKDIAEAESQGADGFILHVERMDECYKNVTSLKKIIDATDKPLMILNYRTEKCGDDEKLTALKIDCLKAGATAVDIPMYTYDGDTLESLKGCNLPFADAKPTEVSMDPSVIEKQKRLIEKIHGLGGEVLMSAHVNTMLNAEQALSLALEIESRGADIVKIILRAKSMDDVAEIYKTLRVLKKELKVPFLYQTGGIYGKLVRQTAWMFGSCMVLCHEKYQEMSNREKPLIADVLAVKERLYNEEF